jgi:hypothetical protein
VPVEVAFFADGGVAWNNVSAASITPSVLGTATVPHPFNIHDSIASAGVTLRVNLFGYAVGQFDFSHPFQRPGHGFVFQFNLSPGF